MAFKGTQTRSAAAIAEAVEDVGGHINAYTAREQTAYYVKLLKEDLALGADIIGDILTHSVFAPEELERERGVILQEIGRRTTRRMTSCSTISRRRHIRTSRWAAPRWGGRTASGTWAGRS